MNWQMKISYPDFLPDCVQKTREEFEQEAKMAMAVKLFEMKRISSGIAAQLVGMERVAFLLKLHQFGVNMIDLDQKELLAEVKNA